MKILSIIPGTIVDGPGLRTSIYFAGCHHQCHGCHNPQSWDMSNGIDMTEDEILDVIRENEFPVTFSGGDPIYQLWDATHLARRIKKELGYNIWLYTGFTFEYLKAHKETAPLLKYIDTIVDGPFVESLRDTSLQFRGSSNQRIIHLHS